MTPFAAKHLVDALGQLALGNLEDERVHNGHRDAGDGDVADEHGQEEDDQHKPQHKPLDSGSHEQDEVVRDAPVQATVLGDQRDRETRDAIGDRLLWRTKHGEATGIPSFFSFLVRVLLTLK